MSPWTVEYVADSFAVLMCRFERPKDGGGVCL